MPQKILVLDDEENYAKMLHSLLEQHYFLVDSATKPEAALRGLEEQGYELVISDYKMPVMDGSDFLEKARVINPDLPVILVSGLMNTPELVKVANMGVTLVLEKPIDIDNFLGHVKRFVQPLGEEEFHRQKNLLESAADGSMGSNGQTYTRNYPQGSRYISDSSLSMQLFLEELWQAAQEQAHLFVKMPSGSELELLLREVSRWQSQPERELFLIDVSTPPPADIVSRLNELPGDGVISNIVGVYGYSESPLELQEAWVDVMREAPESLVFLHGIDAATFAAEPLPINPELYELLMQSLCEMPPLAERLSDVAVYALRLTQRFAKAQGLSEGLGIAPDVMPLLLQYGWPGNYRELSDIIRRAIALLDGDTLTLAAMREILDRTGNSAETSELLSMRKYLQSQQRQYLEQYLQVSGMELSVLLDRMGVDLSMYDSVNSPKDLGLLYPELLTLKG